MTRTPETDLRLFFHPRTIAVIGATDDKRKPGYALLRKVQARAERDGATVYGVNPRLNDIDGIPCFPALADVPGEIDVAVIMIGDAEKGLRDVVAKGAKFAVIFTAGFREVGEEGAKREEELAKIAREGGVRLFGPNTNVNAFEMFPETDGKKLALVTQSGHQGRPIAQGVELGIGVKYWAPTGNEADLEFSDFVEYFVDIDDVSVVAAYIEGFKSIPRLRRAAEKAARAGKPIVMVKIGRTEAGQRMAMAHTGHLTGSDAATNAFFRQYGIVRVDDLDELLETSALFTRLPRPTGEGLCVYAISGGTGAHMADLCAWGGLTLPTLTEESQQKLREAIPDYLTVSNPVDNGAQVVRKGGLNKRCIDICLDDPKVDILVCPITGILPSMSKVVAGDIVDAYKEAKKPVIVIWGSPVTDEEGYRILVEGGVPMFRSFRSFVVGLRRYLDYWQFLDRFEERPRIEPRTPSGFETMLAERGPLSEYDSASLAAQYGVPFPMSALCESEDQAVEAAAKLGGPVVMKACGSGILHKTDAGLVRVGVPQSEVAATFRELDAGGRAHAGDAGYDGVLVQELAGEGDLASRERSYHQVIVGYSHDPVFGPVVLFGIGGIFVEVLKDVALRVAPLSQADAEEMIREIKGFPLLDGARGLQKLDVSAIADLLMKVSRMACELDGRVAEFDLNPVMVGPVGEGLVALDALVVRKGS